MNTLKQYFMPAFMVFCTLLLALWLVLSRANQSPRALFDLTPVDLATFRPALEGWTVNAQPIIRDDLIDANLAAYSVVRDAYSQATSNEQPRTASRFVVRLVHGYNMPMCMKLKYYTVEKIQDNRIHAVSDPKLQSAFRMVQNGQLNPSTGLRASNLAIQQLSTLELPMQLWRLTSSAGTVSIWVTTMIRSGDFSPTSEDICSMAFPRVDIPDDPNWVPRGMGKDELKHPVVAFRRWYHSRWNGARWNVWTFLRLSPPVGASNELLSYVTRVEDLPSDGPKDSDMKNLLEIHAAVLTKLQVWRSNKEGLKH